MNEKTLTIIFILSFLGAAISIILAFLDRDDNSITKSIYEIFIACIFVYFTYYFSIHYTDLIQGQSVSQQESSIICESSYVCPDCGKITVKYTCPKCGQILESCSTSVNTDTIYHCSECDTNIKIIHGCHKCDKILNKEKNK